MSKPKDIIPKKSDYVKEDVPKPKSDFLIQIPNFEKKKSQTNHYNFNDIIMSSDISGKIDTSKWIN